MTATTIHKRHVHEFTELWYHFGPYGRQYVHCHACFTDGCNRVVLGERRACDGKPETHHRETLR